MTKTRRLRFNARTSDARPYGRRFRVNARTSNARPYGRRFRVNARAIYNRPYGACSARDNPSGASRHLPLHRGGKSAAFGGSDIIADAIVILTLRVRDDPAIRNHKKGGTR